MVDDLFPMAETSELGAVFDAVVVSAGRDIPNACWVVVLHDDDNDGAEHFLSFKKEASTRPFKVGTRFRCSYNKHGTLMYTVPPGSKGDA